MKSIRFIALISAAAMCFGLCACGKSEKKDEIAVPILETKDITYKTVKAEIGDISQEYHQEGVYDYPYSETVTFKASGQIKSIDVESPCDVKKGDLLCTLYSDDVDEQIEEEEIRLNQAKQTVATLQANGADYSEIQLSQYDLQIEIADALQGVLSGQYDIAVNNYGYTEERAESYYFSYPYKTTYNVYIQRPDDEPLTSLQDIADRGYKIELEAGGLTANALEQWNEENPDHQIDIVYIETNFQVKFEHIVDGTTDLAIDDGPILDTLLEKFGLEGKLVGNDIDDATQDFLFPHNNTYFLFGKNEEGAALREDVDKVLKEMKEDGTLEKITTGYFGKDTSPKDEYFEETIN